MPAPKKTPSSRNSTKSSAPLSKNPLLIAGVAVVIVGVLAIGAYLFIQNQPTNIPTTQDSTKTPKALISVAGLSANQYFPSTLNALPVGKPVTKRTNINETNEKYGKLNISEQYSGAYADFGDFKSDKGSEYGITVTVYIYSAEEFYNNTMRLVKDSFMSAYDQMEQSSKANFAESLPSAEKKNISYFGVLNVPDTSLQLAANVGDIRLFFPDNLTMIKIGATGGRFPQEKIDTIVAEYLNHIEKRFAAPFSISLKDIEEK